MNLYDLSAKELSDKLIKRDVSAAEVTDAFLSRTTEQEPEISALITRTSDQARSKAKTVDQARAAGERLHPFAGVPIVLKDNLCTAGIETTCASNILRGFVPPYDATVVSKLHDIGLPVIGKANLDEFAMGSSTENSAFFPTKNPWNHDHVPGGSSGGSAASVAARETPWALGSDTGGSIRQPASFCGVVGMKPTYGRVSRYGLVAYASSLDQIGPITRTVYDNAVLLSLISGRDSLDSTSVDIEAPDFTVNCVSDIKGLRLGVPKEYLAEGVSHIVRETIAAAVDHLSTLGAIVEETSLPMSEYALAAYYIIAPAEASSNLARYDGVRFGHRTARAMTPLELFLQTREEGFGSEVKQRIMIGTYALSAGYYDAFYRKAQQVRTLIRREFEDSFKRFDALVTPTAPTPAFRMGEHAQDPLAMKLSDILTIPINLAGVPSISLPCGFSSNGLPVGLQLTGKPFDESTLYRVAYTYEQSTEWHRRSPAN